MEWVKECQSCGSPLSTTSFLTAKDYLVSGSTFSLVSCKRCSMVFTNPRPSPGQMAAYYLSDEYISHIDKAFTLFERLYTTVRTFMIGRKLALLKQNASQGSYILDIGCGTGDFLLKAKEQGYHVIAVEPGEKAAATGTKKALKVFSKADELLPAYKEFFQTISMWHVLEHVSDLKEHLRQCEQLLVPGGTVLVAVPMYKSYDATFYKSQWAAWDLPRHLLHFNDQSIKTAFQHTGFKLLKTKILPFDAFYIAIVSEKHKATRPKAWGFARAMTIGIVSNTLALLGIYPASSKVFVFQK